MISKIIKFALISLLTFSVYADDEDAVKQGLLSTMSSGIASSIASIIGGQGDTEVQFSAKEDNKPQFTIIYDYDRKANLCASRQRCLVCSASTEQYSD